MTPRAAARAIFDAALGAGDVRPLVLRALGAVLLAAVEAALGDRVSGGVFAVKDGHLAETRYLLLVTHGAGC